MSLASHIPPLPVLGVNDDGGWSPNVHRAFNLLDRAYGRAFLVLQEGEQDAHRLHLHADKIMTRSFPILDALEHEGMPQDWVMETGGLLASIILLLEQNAHEADNVYVLQLPLGDGDTAGLCVSEGENRL